MVYPVCLLGIAKPLIQVSSKLGIPPVLGHPSIVLYNWRRFDVKVHNRYTNPLSSLVNFLNVFSREMCAWKI